MPAANAMTLLDALEQRRSIRGFLPQQVPEDVLHSIFSQAQWAPSNCNVQPWLVYVASGECRNELRQRMMDKASNMQPIKPDYDFLPDFSGIYRQRQVDCAAKLYGEMGIARDDREGRMRATLRNFEMFDAPHIAFIGMPRHFGVTVALDVGMYVQTLMLLMTSYGIGCCAQGSMRYYPDEVRDVFGLSQDTGILLGLSFGYEDKAVAANRTRVGRAPLSECVTFKI
ncbi:MAG: nitroreductase [Pseudomonadales bacterium]|nr:nitroreductase [Pseudomonadales bacterium]